MASNPIPPAYPRHHLPIHLGASTKDPVVDFLYDPGATPTCISLDTFHQAQQRGSVQPCPEADLHLASAQGAPMSNTGAQLLTMTIPNGPTFNAPVQVVPGLNRPAILGRNVIQSLGITVDPTSDSLVMDVRQPLDATPLQSSVMAVNQEPDQITQLNQDPDHVDLVTGPIQDPNEEPLAAPEQLFTFHPVENYHLVPGQGNKVVLQAFSPDGTPYTAATEFIANIAPCGSTICHKTDKQGQFAVYFENRRPISQTMVPHLVAAIGVPLDQYYEDRGHKVPPGGPRPWTPAEIAASDTTTKPLATDMDPAVRDHIERHVKGLDPKVRNRMRHLLQRHAKVFATSKMDLGLTKVAKHNIELTDEEPVYTKQFNIPEAHRDFLIRNLRDWISAGIVKKCVSKFNSPIFVVPKQDASLRVVLDYRKLNSKTLPDRYSIKSIEACIGDVGRLHSKYFTTLDLTSAFWQMALEEAHQKYTAFTLPGFGQFQWTRGAMGLTGCPASFARIMDMIMDNLDHVITYIDDVLVHSPTVDDHFTHLDEALARLGANNLKVNLPKCEILKTSVSYLGFTISSSGISPGHRKTVQIQDTPAPTSVRQLQSFIGVCNFFRQFIPNFAMKAGPLYDLIRQDSQYNGGPMPELAQESFKTIRDEIAALPQLGYPKGTGRLHLFVDAALGDDNTAGGLGAALFQEQGPRNRYVPLGFASRRLQKSEARYPIYALELQAAVFGIESFDHILRGRPFHCYTDHKPLITQTKLQAKTLNRLQELLGRHKCTINHVAGKKNIVADYLSRFAHAKEPAEVATVNGVIQKPPLLTLMGQAYEKAQALIARFQQVSSLQAMCTRSEIIEEQNKCKQAQDIILTITKQKQGTVPYAKTREFFLHQGVLCAKDLKTDKATIFVPSGLRKNYMALAHKSVGHGREKKTLDRMQKFVFWPDMRDDLRTFLPTCGPCSVKNFNDPLKNKLPQQPLPQEDRPCARVHLDLFGPLQAPNQQKKYVLVATDAFSKYTKLVIIPNKEEKTVADAFVQQWCHHFGYPRAIVTDQGNEFTNKLLKAILDDAKVRHHTTAPYHPAANGQAEVFNKTMKQYLTATLTEDRLEAHQWEGLISLLQFTYNTSLHRAIKTSPFNVLFGFDPRVPGFEEDADELLRAFKKIDLVSKETPEERWQRAKEANEHDRELTLKTVNKATSIPLFKVNDRVLVLNDHLPAKTVNPKLHPKWVKARIAHLGRGEHNYFVRYGTSKRVCLVHASKLKLDTTPEEEDHDPTVKPPPTARTRDLERRILPPRTRRAPQIYQAVHTIKGWTPPPPGAAWDKMDLQNMFQAYAAHQLTPPSISFSVWAPAANQALLPRAQQAHQAVIPVPIPNLGPQAQDNARRRQRERQRERRQQQFNQSREREPHTPQGPPTRPTPAPRASRGTPRPARTPQGPAPPATPTFDWSEETNSWVPSPAPRQQDGDATSEEPMDTSNLLATRMEDLQKAKVECNKLMKILDSTPTSDPRYTARQEALGMALYKKDELEDLIYEDSPPRPPTRRRIDPTEVEQHQEDMQTWQRQQQQFEAGLTDQEWQVMRDLESKPPELDETQGAGALPPQLAGMNITAPPAAFRRPGPRRVLAPGHQQPPPVEVYQEESELLDPSMRALVWEAEALPGSTQLSEPDLTLPGPAPSFRRTLQAQHSRRPPRGDLLSRTLARPMTTSTASLPAHLHPNIQQAQAHAGMQLPPPAVRTLRYASWEETPEGVQYNQLRAARPPTYTEPALMDDTLPIPQLTQLAWHAKTLQVEDEAKKNRMFMTLIGTQLRPEVRAPTQISSLRSFLTCVIKDHNQFLRKKHRQHLAQLKEQAQARFTNQTS